MNKQDLLAPRVREFVNKAKARAQEWRELDLTKFDAELVTPDGAPQTLHVWVNAPSALRQAMAALELYNGDLFYAVLSEYCGIEPDALRDLFDAWSDELRQFVVRRVFEIVNAYQQERLDFLFSPPTDSMTSNSESSASPNGSLPQPAAS